MCFYDGQYREIILERSTYTAQSYAVFVESRPFDHIRFQGIVYLWYEFKCQRLASDQHLSEW